MENLKFINVRVNLILKLIKILMINIVKKTKNIIYKFKREHYIEVAIVINIKNNKENRKYEVYKCEPEPIYSTPLGVSNQTDAPATSSSTSQFFSSSTKQNLRQKLSCRRRTPDY